MVKFVSACVERDKKNFEKTDFCAQLPAFLIENLTQIMWFLDAGFEVCGLC